MALPNILIFYEWLLNISDPRVTNWPLMPSYLPTLTLTIIYLISVFSGIRIMANRSPYRLRNVLIVYNFLMIILNIHICTELFIQSWNLRYNYFCQPLNSDPLNVGETKVNEFYQISNHPVRK